MLTDLNRARRSGNRPGRIVIRKGQPVMASERQFAKERDAADVFTALGYIVTRHDLWNPLAAVMSDEGLACFKRELAAFADFFSANKDRIPDAEELAGRLRVWLTPRPSMGLPAVAGTAALLTAARTEAAETALVKAPKVAWTTHKKGDKKTHWTSKWQGFNLKVVRTKPEGEVIFVGYIDDMESPVTQASGPGGLSRTQAAVEMEALKRLTARR